MVCQVEAKLFLQWSPHHPSALAQLPMVLREGSTMLLRERSREMKEEEEEQHFHCVSSAEPGPGEQWSSCSRVQCGRGGRSMLGSGAGESSCGQASEGHLIERITEP